MDMISKITVILTGLSKEYIPFLSRIGASLGIALEIEDSLAAQIDRFNGLPSIRALVQDVSNLPTFIPLPKPGGGKLQQVMDYTVFPTSALIVKKVGNLTWDCPNKAHGEKSAPQGPSKGGQEWNTVQKGKKKVHS